MRRLLLLLSLLGLAACASSGLASRRVAFDPGEYAAYEGRGTSAIEGRVELPVEGGAVVGAGAVVNLLPATPDGTEWFERTVRGGEVLEAADARAAGFHRTAHTGMDGSFRFEGLRPGRYYLASKLIFDDPARGRAESWARAVVTVPQGETVRVQVSR